MPRAANVTRNRSIVSNPSPVRRLETESRRDILKAIARGQGPDEAIFALGYAGWASGQLESEIQDNGWMICPLDRKVLFDQEFDTKYLRALGSLGIDPAMLSPLAIILAMNFGLNRMSETSLKGLFWGFAALMGVSMSVIFARYTGASIAQTFFASAAEGREDRKSVV